MKKLDFEQMVFVPLPGKRNIALDGRSPALAQSILQAFGKTSGTAKEAPKSGKGKPVTRPSGF
ncbi:hypothetical protein [Silvimonas iriomotensis]|uniref:hypothetical protein n=1 Tax=Silvimonas iriomotensis TaxID=449662 RepID=UPI00166EABA2|nr:hypothetical protein [Silvimonas iriomotensis]